MTTESESVIDILVEIERDIKFSEVHGYDFSSDALRNLSKRIEIAHAKEIEGLHMSQSIEVVELYRNRHDYYVYESEDKVPKGKRESIPADGVWDYFTKIKALKIDNEYYQLVPLQVVIRD